MSDFRKRWHLVADAFCPADYTVWEYIDAQKTVENRLLIF